MTTPNARTLAKAGVLIKTVRLGEIPIIATSHLDVALQEITKAMRVIELSELAKVQEIVKL